MLPSNTVIMEYQYASIEHSYNGIPICLHRTQLYISSDNKIMIIFFNVQLWSMNYNFFYRHCIDIELSHLKFIRLKFSKWHVLGISEHNFLSNSRQVAMLTQTPLPPSGTPIAVHIRVQHIISYHNAYKDSFPWGSGPYSS